MQEVKDTKKLSEKLLDVENGLYKVSSLIFVTKEYSFEHQSTDDPRDVIDHVFNSLEIAYEKLNTIVEYLNKNISELEEMEKGKAESRKMKSKD